MRSGGLRVPPPAPQNGGNTSSERRDAAYEAKRQAIGNAWKSPPDSPGGGQQFKSRSQSEPAGGSGGWAAYRRQGRPLDDATVRNRVAEWLRLLEPTVELVDAEVPRVEAEAGELLDVRAQIIATKKAMAELASAPAASAELKAAVKAHVADRARMHTPRLRMGSGGVATDWMGGDVLGPDAVFGILCWLAPNAATDRLMAEVITLTGGQSGVSEADQARREAELGSILLDLERQEEAILSALIDAGIDCTRRIDASPQAILQVTVRQSAAAA
jgi:hypothetical protein